MGTESTKHNWRQRITAFFKSANSVLSRFIETDFYILLIGALVFLSWVTNNLVPELIIIFFIMAYVLYTQKTMKALVPILIMIAFMLPANFQFNDKSLYWYFGIIGLLPISGFFYFFIKNKIKFKKSRFLLPSVVFCAALLVSGLFSPYYFKSVNFMMIACFVFLYLFIVLVLYNGIDKLEFRYIAKCLFMAGLVIATQILIAYIRAGGFALGLKTKGTTEIGWGMSNTAAAALSMCVPVAFYMASKSRFNVLYIVAAVYFILGVLFTKSRGGVLFMVLLLPVSIVSMFLQTQKGRRLRAGVTLLTCLVGFAVLLLAFWEDIGEVVTLFKNGFDDSDRFPIYIKAINAFLEYPVFGVGWLFDTAGEEPFAIFFTVHSTIFQYIASGGIFLTLAAIWLFGKRYLTFYADFKPYHIFFLVSLLSHDLYGFIDNTATLPYCIMIAGIIFIALEKDIRPEVEAQKRAAYKKERFLF